MNENIKRLEKNLGYTFKTLALLKQALSHRSVGEINNERLEFLGDSILSFVVASQLIAKFPDETEGQLSRLRSHLVKGETLAKIALEIDLGDFLLLGQGELKSGGFRRESILADALEAVFAAIYLDGGLEASQNTILKLFASRLESHQLHDNLKDAKTRLQEYLQAQQKPLPNYKLIEIEGEEHDQLFSVRCTLPNTSLSSQGKGRTRRKAEQEAATILLKQFKHDVS